MFCPKCGKADQLPETYCRQCGTFLPDLAKPAKKEISAEENIKVNTVLSVMTVIVCFTLSTLMYSMLAFRPDTHPLIYVTAALLLAMGGWHIQTFIRTRKLKKQWKIRNAPHVDETSPAMGTAQTAKLLERADFENIVPASVTDSTTRHLSESALRSSDAQH